MKRTTAVTLCTILLGVFCQWNAAGSGTWFKDFPVGDIFRTALVHAQDWRAEYDDICAKTDVAMQLSEEELKKLIERCDKLKAIIEGFEVTQRKVFLKRLQMCRDLFAYVLESKLQK